MTATYDDKGMPVSFGDEDVRAWMQEPEVQTALKTVLGTKLYYIGHLEGESCAEHVTALKTELQPLSPT